jgi:sugar lactone lactonase YvrE
LPRPGGGAPRAKVVIAALAAVLSVHCTQPPAAPAPTRLTFTLPEAALTSAGVYNLQGQLLRTLWRGEALAAGSHERSWDQYGDSGQLLASGEYQFKLIRHPIAHVWEGVIGNTSSALGGPAVHKAFLPPTAIAIDGARAIYATGYNEGQSGLHGFALAAPQVNTRPYVSTDPFVAYTMLALDATRLYWANTGGLLRTSFIAGIELQSGARVTWPAGQPICVNIRVNTNQCYSPDNDYQGVIDLNTDPAALPTGLAVQRNGRVLAVAHGARNLVRLFDKTSGVPLREFPVALHAKAINQLAMTSGGDLWVISGNGAIRYTDLERQPTPTASIVGLTRPLALATDPLRDDGVWIADGGASQQIKHFSNAGVPDATIGQAGGYGADPAVAANKLCFKAREVPEQTAIAVAPDATLWVVDTCNHRMLRFRLDALSFGTNDAQVAYLPAVYTATVDHARPRRVFANFLEFDVENGVALQPGRSWTLLRNWLPSLPAGLRDEPRASGAWGGFATVETLSNGRTYAMVHAHSRQFIVELPAGGPLRVVKEFAAPAPNTTAKVLYENGDLGYALTGPNTQSVLRLPLMGFDPAGDPQWPSEPVRMATVPLQTHSPHYRGSFSGALGPRFPLTASGKVVFFDPSVNGNEGFHLGAAAQGDAGWLWQASPSGALDGKGSFQTRAIDGSLQYGGNAVWAHERHIVYGYHGEFYKDMSNGRTGQANQFMHFDESGLFIGQFGQSSTRPSSPLQEGLSGNSFSPTLVRSGNQLYLYHNDESQHGGVHRWRIDGWQGIRDLIGSGAAGSTITLR